MAARLVARVFIVRVLIGFVAFQEVATVRAPHSVGARGDT
eukprot:CAMPEP_0172624094 /NCGR_PEP_ID=MMETSP1068-20121228/133816_1 /TAXON_ID=35684 /ORGANISM="Pseudopedinella elastica, Strain CCMP716" /LENGTH=39 /DNA_ID= /DNA_START= /DNA_END= /DNA_ORIENTATION=